MISFIKNADGVTFRLNKGLMNIRVCKADIIEVKYTILNALPVKNSLVVNNPWAQNIPFTVVERNGQVVITTAKLKISINKTTNAITYTDLKGLVITSQTGENNTMKGATIAGIDTYNCSTTFNSRPMRHFSV